MTIRTITPPFATSYGPDTTAQFAELKNLEINVVYEPTGPVGEMEQWVQIDIRMEVWSGGASAAEGAAPVRTDLFSYKVKPSNDAWPLTQADWDTIRGYIYGTVQTDPANPVDDPMGYARGTVFYD